jgi:uncharacterized protein with von Willebrand factor type A (vWA) domain
MRIIRLKLQKKVEEYISLLPRRFKMTDAMFIQDVYAIVKLRGNGLPDDARVEKIAEHYSKGRKVGITITRIMVKKRKQILKSLSSTALFSSFVKGVLKENELEFTEKLLLTFRKLHRKLRQAQCLSCVFISQCEFGKQYSAKVRNIGIVVDPDYQRKVHQDCPSLPEIEFSNEIFKAAQFANSMAQESNATAMKNAVGHGEKNPLFPGPENLTPEEIKEVQESEQKAQEESEEFRLDELSSREDEDDEEEEFIAPIPSSEGSRFNEAYSTSHSGGQGVILDDSLIDRIKMSSLIIYELSQKLEMLLHRKSKLKFKPTEELTRERTTSQIRALTDIPKVIPSQHALPDEVFERKLVKKELVKVQQQENPKLKKQLLFVLIDSSGSMTSSAGLGGIFGFVTRGALAATFSLALSKRTRDDKGILYIRFFEGKPDKLLSCRTIEEFRNLEDLISECAFDGFSTNIPSAIRTAVADIRAAKDELSKAEILMITDAGDHISPSVQEELRKLLGEIPLNILDVSGDALSGGATQVLKELSDNYLKVEPGQTTLEKIVNLVGGKKKVAHSK